MAPKKNAPQPAFVHSTPQKNKLICKYCSKVYQVKFYYDQHVASHESTTSSDASILNNTLAVQLNDSNICFANASFRVPNIPAKKARISKKPKPKAKYVSTYCLKGYQCQRYFKSHSRMHVIEDAASRYPDRDKFLEKEKCENLASAALTKVSEAPSCGESGNLFRLLVGHIISLPKADWKNFSVAVCEELLKEIWKKKVLLPSALVVTLFTSVETVLSDTEICDNF